jgi:hypothetical protein
MKRWKILILSAVVTVAVLGLGLVVGVLGRSLRREPAQRGVDFLAQSADACVECHRRTTPGIVEQYGRSTMAAAKVGCRDCHAVVAGYPGATAHEGAFILRSPTTASCQRCHVNETAQFLASRHSLPAFVGYAGTAPLSPEHRKMYEAIPEGQVSNKMRNALFAIEGPEITKFACQSCHDVGAPRQDGSVGRCEKCHLRHEFSLAQARKPQTCNNCHIGPDHPQWEIYQESPHGILFATQGDGWHWDAKPGTLTPKDMPAPTCATCHFSGFGGATTTHEVGERLSWFLFSPVSERRPAWQDNRLRMKAVCAACHNKSFIDAFYEAADLATEKVNAWVRESDAIVAPIGLKERNAKEPFTQPIDFEHFELWHHWGRTAKFGVWMQGPDYTQWHGAYEVVKALVRLKADVAEKAGDAKAPAPPPAGGK